MQHYDVPFVENPDDKCVPATIGMILGYFMPEKNYDMPDLIKFSGYIEGQGTWSVKSMLSLSLLGFETSWIEDFDNPAFAESPTDYLATILDKDALEWQVKHSNLRLEANRIREYINIGHRIEHRRGTRKDIKTLLNDGWLVRLEINANTLADRGGYQGHSILVIGYNNEQVEIHNPDGENGNKPNQILSWDKLERAWKEFGGSYSLYGFRMKR